MNITGTILKDLRMKQQISLQELANELNAEFDAKISRGTLSRWENGKSVPGYTNLKNLAKHFNVTTDFLRGSSVNNFQNMNIKSNTYKQMRKTKKSS